MSKEQFTEEEIKKNLETKLARFFGVMPDEANANQVYKATILTVRDILTQKRSDFKEKVKARKARRVYYLCMEFLVGRSLKSSLMNLGIAGLYEKALSDMGFSLDSIYEMEPDPGLGNGGLGRLAACFMDSLSTLSYPATGFSICYEYGLFKQKIIDGNQIELPDEWMSRGDAWLNPRTDRAVNVRFGGHVTENWQSGKCSITYEDCDEVQAVPYDMMISGAGGEAVNLLRLWRAHDTKIFDMSLFSQGEYVRALQETTDAEIISKVLYPSDNHDEGKMLRLTQQYFLVSASLQNIIADHLAVYGTLYNFADKVAIHINDTHPALCIPELMRILMDIYSYTWEAAWSVVTRVISYTNHTVMPEALECWNEGLFALKLPRIHMLVKEINRRLCADLWNMYPGDWDRISRMSVIAQGQVRMANLSVAASHKVNGVSALHSDILTKTVFHDYYKAFPDKFTNVTNGIAYRRWLCYSNPGLSALLDECIGTAYRTDSERLEDFRAFKDDKPTLERLMQIKADNKVNFAALVEKNTGVRIDPSSIFDVQVKRMHEYKRQLLNALKIISLYNDILENPNADITPATFIFGGKAAPGYYMAKDIIKLIWSIGQEFARDTRVRDKIRVIYLEDYNVTTTETLMPASDISEQISLAGKEASGTGCMKFMINGALTLGTLDGANIEMMEKAGAENFFIFGLNSTEVDELWKRGYDSAEYCRKSERLSKTVETLRRGFYGNSFEGMANYLLHGAGIADPYMCMADFDSYFSTYEAMCDCYADSMKWAKKSLCNIAGAGYFSSDRSIREYAEKIWNLSPVK